MKWARELLKLTYEETGGNEEERTCNLINSSWTHLLAIRTRKDHSRTPCNRWQCNKKKYNQMILSKNNYLPQYLMYYISHLESMKSHFKPFVEKKSPSSRWSVEGDRTNCVGGSTVTPLLLSLTCMVCCDSFRRRDYQGELTSHLRFSCFESVRASKTHRQPP